MGVTPFRVLITLLITYILSPLPLQVGVQEFRGLGVTQALRLRGPFEGSIGVPKGLRLRVHEGSWLSSKG